MSLRPISGSGISIADELREKTQKPTFRAELRLLRLLADRPGSGARQVIGVEGGPVQRLGIKGGVAGVGAVLVDGQYRLGMLGGHRRHLVVSHRGVDTT